MENSKLIKKSAAIFIIALSLVLSTCVSILCSAMAADNAIDRDINLFVKDAENSVKEFSNNSAYNSFAFSDSLYSKASVVDIAVDEKTSSDNLSTLAKKLSLNSFAVTDTDGLIIAAYPEDAKGTNMLDNNDLAQFKPTLKGISVKSISTATPVDGEQGKHKIKACVTRAEGGVVIIDATVDNYHLVSGENIANACKGSTIIAKNGDIVSTNISAIDKTTLSDIGIDEGKLKGGKFDVAIGGERYTLKSNSTNGYTVISGIQASQHSADYLYSAVMAIIANAIIFAILTAVIIILTKKKQ